MDTSSSAHGAGVAASSSSSRSSNRWKYEVFVSFRGEDTRNTFTDHLDIAFRKAGINAFIDNQLTRGENIQSELDREIEGSRIAVIVFSKGYADSRWCLRELSKIMRCLKDQKGKIVCPIFYDVDPSQVRKQNGSFSKAFRKHKRNEDPNEVKQWREDLKASADLAGWDLKTTADGREGVFIEKIIGDIKGLLKPTYSKEAKHSIGIAFRVQEFGTKYLDVGGSPDVQIIGIWGTGGIGKTTLARAICSKYGHSFSSQCYLEEVRSNKKNMVSLQEQLLRDILKRPDIKVSNVAEGTKEIEKRLKSIKGLVVVDDIDDADQLDKLAIAHDSFGPGSRIIITTRDEQVLNIQKVDKRYKAQGMTDDEAFELLSWHAFGNPRPDEEYIELTRDVVDYCGELPLALEVVGRLLATKKSKSIWQSTLDKLRNIPDGKIHETLKLSYDGLRDDHVKGVFLDISCFFIGLDKSFVMAILDGCSRFSVEAEITTLCERCLLYIENQRLRMHDLIRDMGREIVRAESPVELAKRSRLWHSEDAKNVLRSESGTEVVEGLNLILPEHEQSFRTKAFKKMRRLKFLQLANVKLTGCYKHLSKELRSLTWIGFPLEAIPADFDQRNLVYMELRYSKIVRVWEDSELLPKKLKYLFLLYCHNLTELPDFSKLPHLKALNLSGCKGLCGGYHFLAQLKMIEVLELSYCNITDGAVLKIIGSLSSLTVLDLGGNGFSRLPILSGLSQLQGLRLNHCTNLQAIPDLPNSLHVLKANYCTALEIMSDFSEMSKMWKLELKDCRKLKDIPNLENSLDNMNSIHMEGCTSLTDTFKENLQTKNAFGGIFLSGNDIPNWLAYVAGEDETVKFEAPPSIDYIGGLALGIVYSSDNSDSTGSLYIDVANPTQRTYFRIWPMEATVTASHEYYLWLGNLSNKKLNLKGGDMVLVKAKLYGDNRIKVNKTGVDIVKWDLSDDGTNWDDYEKLSYESDEDSEDDTQLSNRHVFLCHKTSETWPWHIKGFESDPLPKFSASALKGRKNDITAKTLLTVIEGRVGTEFSDGDVLIFPQMIKYRREGVFIEKIIGDIKGQLKPRDFKKAKHSIGIAFRVQEFNTKYLDVGGSPDVQIIGIWGTGGIGKTTLAREIYSKYSHSFSSQCYLEDVRSKKKNMVSLQEQLLRDILKQPDIKVSSVAEGTKEMKKRLGSMKVLVVVDDIDDAYQLVELAIKHESFGPGSRIIITTRDEHVLNIQKVDKKYKAQAMTEKEALELLSWHAFGNYYPNKEYIELARDIVDYCGGLPLALKVLGLWLANKKSKTIWESTLDKLRNNADEKNIHEMLKLSYDGLRDGHVKGVFLDISCFFIGWDKRFVTTILNDCSCFSVEAEITTLCDRCLLYIYRGKLRMHDLIEDMGREIVRAESPVELGKRSRLWHSEDAKSVLRNESGTEAVEGLNLILPEHEQSFSTEAFKKMWRLKFLWLENVKLTGSYKHLSKELRLLKWNGFPLEAIPADFDQRNLVYMELRYSKIVRVWEDSELLPKKLKYLILRHCRDLTELPDFSKLPHLEALALSDCNITDGAVLEIIGSLSSLTYLDLGGNGFNRLPILSGLSQLQILHLNDCTNLQAIPDLPNSLHVLTANYCTALEIMSDFSEMSKMMELELKDCRKLKDIPNLENSMDYVDSIHMEGCTSLTDTFKENLQTKNAFDGIFLSGNDIPNRLAYVAREDETVKFEVPPNIDYIGGLALGIVYSSDNSYSTGFLSIDVVNRTQRTHFCIRAMMATVTASHEYYLWLGNLSNKKLYLKGGDMVLVKAEFYEQDNRIKVKKTGVDIVKWDLSDGRTNWDGYETMSYESDEDTDDDTQLNNRHVFLCYKTPEAWPWLIEGSKSDPLPKFFASALKARKNDITVKTLLTVIEGCEGIEFSDGDVLIFPQMIKYRGLKESDVDSFVDDVLVNDKPWASGVQEPLTGSHVFVCAHGSREEWNRDNACVLINKFKEEAELRGLTNQVFVGACFHTGGHNGNLIIYNPGSDGSITGHWYGYVTPDDVPELFDEHIGKGEIIERLWRGQIGASSDEAEEINDRELPNGEENKKIEDKPQENSNQIHQEKGNHIENSENDESEEKQLKETRESCARNDALGKLLSLIGELLSCCCG